jgi:RNA polymerase primary sigma factor
MSAIVSSDRADRAVAISFDAAPDTAPSFLEPVRATAAPAENPERNNLQLYLQEIGKTPLLTIDEEVKLAKRIMKGDLSLIHI